MTTAEEYELEALREMVREIDEAFPDLGIIGEILERGRELIEAAQ